MTTQHLNPIYEATFLTLLLDLVEICDSFDQLAKMARIVHILYNPTDYQAKQLQEQIRKTYVHLRHIPIVGSEIGS